MLLYSLGGYFLRFALEEVPEKRKSALGVHGMKMAEKDYLEWVSLLKGGQEFFDFRSKGIAVARVKEAKRDEKGTKLRI